MKKFLFISILFLFLSSCVKYETEIVTKYQLEDFMNLNNWKSEMFFYSYGNNPIPFSIDKNNINNYNLFGDWTDVSSSAFYVHSNGDYSEKSYIKFDENSIFLRTSHYITNISTYSPFNDYHITFHPYEFTIFSTDMDIRREWSETKNITIEYDQINNSGAVINNFSETVLAKIEYFYHELEEEISFNNGNNPDASYYEAVELRVLISFNSDVVSSKFTNKYYFSKDQGLVGFRTNNKVFRVDY